jgi:hypothetical protein
LNRTITDPYELGFVLRQVAGALAAAGQEEKAEQVALGITDPRQQAKAMVDVATACARRDDNSARAGSRRIVARILASNSWYHAVPVLTSLDPGAASSIGDAILNFELPPRSSEWQPQPARN